MCIGSIYMHVMHIYIYIYIHIYSEYLNDCPCGEFRDYDSRVLLVSKDNLPVDNQQLAKFRRWALQEPTKSPRGGSPDIGLRALSSYYIIVYHILLYHIISYHIIVYHSIV